MPWVSRRYSRLMGLFTASGEAAATNARPCLVSLRCTPWRSRCWAACREAPCQTCTWRCACSRRSMRGRMAIFMAQSLLAFGWNLGYSRCVTTTEGRMSTVRELADHELDMVGGGSAGVDPNGTTDNASGHSAGNGAMCNYIMRAPGTSTGAPTISHEWANSD